MEAVIVAADVYVDVVVTVIDNFHGESSCIFISRGVHNNTPKTTTTTTVHGSTSNIND
jgi:hypothetical protein